MKNILDTVMVTWLKSHKEAQTEANTSGQRSSCEGGLYKKLLNALNKEQMLRLLL